MLKIFKLETVFLARPAVLLAATAAFFLIGDRSRGDYRAAEQVQWMEQVGVEAQSVQSAQPLININTADEDQLQTLPGIGPVKAEAIIAWREEHGPFSCPEDLIMVSGIGEATLAKLLDQITVGGE